MELSDEIKGQKVTGFVFKVEMISTLKK